MSQLSDYAVKTYSDLTRVFRGERCIHCKLFPEEHVDGRCLFVAASKYAEDVEQREQWEQMLLQAAVGNFYAPVGAPKVTDVFTEGDTLRVSIGMKVAPKIAYIPLVLSAV